MSVIIKQEPPLDIPLVLVPAEEEVLPTPASEPVPFCTLCLRECPAFENFYECNPENSTEFCNFVRELLGIEFKEQNFNICKTCWKVVQMMGDFRRSCLKGQSWLERFEGGLGCIDDWHAEEIVQTIDYLQTVIEDHGKRFEESESEDELMMTISTEQVKIQPSEPEEDVSTEVPVENESDCSEEMMEQDSTEDEYLNQKMWRADKTADVDKSGNQKLHSKTTRHKKPIDESIMGILVDISRLEVRDPILNKVIAIYDNEANIIRCEICDTDYSDKKCIKKHIRSKKHKLKVKELKLNQGVLVNISKQEVHDPVMNKITAIFDYEAKIFRCEICNINFAMRQCLRTHLRLLRHQLRIKKFRKKSPNSKDLKKLTSIRPTKVVHSAAQYECHYCGEKFKLKYSVKRHIFTQHVNPKRFPCTACKKVFREASTLEGHMVIHGNQPYKCNKCEKGYFKEDDLKKHKRKKH